tara:strand:+ start:2396 stop:2638 length:243 start_codon:yes stop_codon:yes gene_type:complete
MERNKISCKGYEITLTDRETGKSVAVTLDRREDLDKPKWMVNGDKYVGYFSNLETAWKEACRHVKYETKGMKDEIPGKKL